MRPSITALTILSLIAFSPSGYAQQAGSKENPLSGTQTDRIVAPDSTDIYVSGDVIFEDMTSSDSVGGAAIGVGTANKNTDPIVVRILGATEGKQDNLSFINNAIENKWNLGGAVGSKEMTYPITIAFENLNQLIFDNNRIEGGLYIINPAAVAASVLKPSFLRILIPSPYPASMTANPKPAHRSQRRKLTPPMAELCAATLSSLTTSILSLCAIRLHTGIRRAMVPFPSARHLRRNPSFPTAG